MLSTMRGVLAGKLTEQFQPVELQETTTSVEPTKLQETTTSVEPTELKRMTAPANYKNNYKNVLEQIRSNAANTFYKSEIESELAEIETLFKFDSEVLSQSEELYEILLSLSKTDEMRVVSIKLNSLLIVFETEQGKNLKRRLSQAHVTGQFNESLSVHSMPECEQDSSMCSEQQIRKEEKSRVPRNLQFKHKYLMSLILLYQDEIDKKHGNIEEKLQLESQFASLRLLVSGVLLIDGFILDELVNELDKIISLPSHADIFRLRVITSFCMVYDEWEQKGKLFGCNYNISLHEVGSLELFKKTCYLYVNVSKLFSKIKPHLNTLLLHTSVNATDNDLVLFCFDTLKGLTEENAEEAVFRVSFLLDNFLLMNPNLIRKVIEPLKVLSFNVIRLEKTADTFNQENDEASKSFYQYTKEELSLIFAMICDENISEYQITLCINELASSTEVLSEVVKFRIEIILSELYYEYNECLKQLVTDVFNCYPRELSSSCADKTPEELVKWYLDRTKIGRDFSVEQKKLSESEIALDSFIRHSLPLARVISHLSSYIAYNWCDKKGHIKEIEKTDICSDIDKKIAQLIGREIKSIKTEDIVYDTKKVSSIISSKVLNRVTRKGVRNLLIDKLGLEDNSSTRLITTSNLCVAVKCGKVIPFTLKFMTSTMGHKCYEFLCSDENELAPELWLENYFEHVIGTFITQLNDSITYEELVEVNHAYLFLNLFWPMRIEERENVSQAIRSYYCIKVAEHFNNCQNSSVCAVNSNFLFKQINQACLEGRKDEYCWDTIFDRIQKKLTEPSEDKGLEVECKKETSHQNDIKSLTKLKAYIYYYRNHLSNEELYAIQEVLFELAKEGVAVEQVILCLNELSKSTSIAIEKKLLRIYISLFGFSEQYNLTMQEQFVCIKQDFIDGSLDTVSITSERFSTLCEQTKIINTFLIGSFEAVKTENISAAESEALKSFRGLCYVCLFRSATLYETLVKISDGYTNVEGELILTPEIVQLVKFLDSQKRLSQVLRDTLEFDTKVAHFTQLLFCEFLKRVASHRIKGHFTYNVQSICDYRIDCLNSSPTAPVYYRYITNPNAFLLELDVRVPDKVVVCFTGLTKLCSWIEQRPEDNQFFYHCDVFCCFLDLSLMNLPRCGDVSRLLKFAEIYNFIEEHWNSDSFTSKPVSDMAKFHFHQDIKRHLIQVQQVDHECIEYLKSRGLYKNILDKPEFDVSVNT